MDNGESSYRRFLSGDRSGLEDIIRLYKDGLILYLYTIVGSLHAAEETAEDTFVRLYVRKPRFSGRSSFKTWLYSLGRHIAVDFIRSQSRRKYVPVDGVGEAADMLDIERNYIKQEERIELRRAMQKLSPDYFQVLYLTYFEDFELTETARIMKRSSRQISNLLYNAKKALKRELEKEGFVYEGL